MKRHEKTKAVHTHTHTYTIPNVNMYNYIYKYIYILSKYSKKIFTFDKNHEISKTLLSKIKIEILKYNPLEFAGVLTTFH